MTQRTEAEGTSTWTYDTKSKGIGKPAVITGPNGYKKELSEVAILIVDILHLEVLRTSLDAKA
jgi:hypothetical protein